MIDLFTWTTPNGYKASIALEELGLDYRVRPVNLGDGDQHRPDFLAVNPNNKIPAITDHEGPDGGPVTVFESGAILLYLAEKTGRLLPSDPAGRIEAVQWLMWQMGGVGPMLGQAFHFRHTAPETVEYGIRRYTDEARRLYRVADQRLADREFLAGDYSVADIACFPWLRLADRIGLDLDEFPHVARWVDQIADRPAVLRGLAVPPGS